MLQSMKAFRLLLLALLVPSVSAAITFELTPTTQVVNPGDTVYLDLSATNDESFWGFSVKIDENLPGPITFVSGTPSNRLQGSLNGVAQNTPDRITPYAAFGGNTPGITPGNGQLFRLQYNIPTNTAAGTYQLVPSQLTVSNQQGNNIQGATISGASITVQGTQPTQEPTEQPTVTPQPTQPSGETGFYLPDVYGFIEQTIEIPICVTNTQPGRNIANVDVTITHDENVVKVTGVDINQGTGNADIQTGNTRLQISGLNIQNADCDEQTGATIATIHYYLRKLGVSVLHFETVSAIDQSSQLFSVQPLENEDGQISVGVSSVTKSCEASPGIITLGGIVTITYKISNPASPPDIGGFDEQDTFDSGATGLTPSLPPTNLVAGSSLIHSTPDASTVRVVMTTATQPLLAGPGTFNVYSIDFTSGGSTTLGSHNFGILPPPPPDLEISDDAHNDLESSAVSCSVDVIESCEDNNDCNDGNPCNGQETCLQGDCVPGTPLNCDDGNSCTNDFCSPTSGCQHASIPNCGRQGGGGGGGNQQSFFTGCGKCDNPSYPDWDECCGNDIQQVNRFCERPDTYPNYCKRKNIPVETPQQSSAGVPTPEQPLSSDEIVKQMVEITPKPAPQRQAPITEPQPKSPNMLSWIIGALILVLLGGILGYALMRRRQEPELPVPAPVFTPEPETPLVQFPVEEPEAPQPKPAPRPIVKPLPQRIITPVPREPVDQNAVALIRRRLQQRMKAKKRKR